MKAIAINKFGNPDVFESVEISTPEIDENELLIEIVGGSVNPVDWKQRKGNHRLIFGSKFPIVLGYDISGKVVQKGSKVTSFNVGDAVCGVLGTSKYAGGLAQFAKGPEKCFAKLAPDAPIDKYAVLPLAALTSLQALRDKGKIKNGDKLLIIGAAGGVGHYALQIAQIFGAEIFSVSSERHKDFLDKLPKSHFIDYQKQNILELKNKFDIIYDGVGKYSFLKCRKLLKPGGIYINTLPRPKILIHKIFALFTRGKKVKGVLMKHDSKDLAQLVQWVSEGKIKLCIDREFLISEIAQAHAYSEEGHTEGKILIRYSW